MLLGIDVGGTYTDAALYEAGRILKTCKHVTQPEDLKISLINAMQELLSSPQAAGKTVSRIVIGTTLVTNLLVTGRGEEAALILLPGRSLPEESYEIAPHQYFLRGMVDFRGRVVEEIPQEELDECIAWLVKNRFSQVAVAGKFSNRNPEQELQIALELKRRLPQCAVVLSHQVSARLNFPRRAVTAYYTARVQGAWNQFADELQKAMEALHMDCEVQILKADGGTLPLKEVEKTPCETIFSGPAASIMGAMALHPNAGNAVVVDVGGTTCDLALIVDGQPLYASRGAKIAGKPTQIDAFSVDSLALGGDSVIDTTGGTIKVQPYREGPALCLSGHNLTLTDVINVRRNLQLGDAAASEKAVQEAAEKLSLTPEDFCAEVEKQALEKLLGQIHTMFRQWEKEPAYKVWEVVHRQPFKVEKLIGIGAGANLLLPQTAESLQVPFVLSGYASVANAVGAALVRPTLRVTLHADTVMRQYTISPPTVTESLPRMPRVQLEQMKTMAVNHLKELCQERNIPMEEKDAVFFLEEQFNVIGGWNETSGRIFDVGVQIQPGFIAEFTGVIE